LVSQIGNGIEQLAVEFEIFEGGHNAKFWQR
jgi:hypothetical protein